MIETPHTDRRPPNGANGRSERSPTDETPWAGLTEGLREIAGEVRRLVGTKLDLARFSLVKVGFALAIIPIALLTVTLVVILAAASVVRGVCSATEALLGAAWAGELVGGLVVLTTAMLGVMFVWRATKARFFRRLVDKYPPTGEPPARSEEVPA